ncbi:MAG: divergent PAP2 family protein [Oscillospiraceae bacterium]|nr:divergent PAP2 family protein [Oscillospiraceae bacterium]
MNWLTELFTNPFLITSTSSWLIAQVMKVIINFCVTRQLSWERLFGDGGMPSGHSATVSSLAIFAALRCGCGSFEFAVTAILAIIVCHDAMGVRQETGKQAVIINEMVQQFEKLMKQDITDIDLKELVGHTPLQVIAGITVGICNALIMHFLVFN